MRVIQCLLGLGIAMSGLIAASAFAAGPVAPVSFPQDHSEISPNADQVYGRLPNGMTYILEHNVTPSNTASIYLRVATGSMMETPNQRGLAHFIEHMAFNGTTHIKEGELKRILERKGFQFGADVNAYTTPSKTVYTLDAPKSDADTLDTALFIMREVAGNLTLGSGAIDRERGVVLSEERARDTPDLHKQRAWDNWLYAGQIYASNSSPIGSTDIIRHASRDDLSAFYSTWYRPDQTTLIVVGDFDPTVMAGKITMMFGDWTAKAPPPQEPDWGDYKAKGLRTFSYAEKGLTEELSLTWVKPVDTRHDSQAKRTERLQEFILRTLFQRRLQKMAQDPASPLVAAGIETYSTFHTSRNVNVWAVPKPGKTQQAFDLVYGAVRTFKEQGLTDAEVGAMKGMVSLANTEDDASLKTLKNSQIADNLIDALDGDEVDEGPSDNRIMQKASALHFSRDEMNARIKAHLDGDGPILGHVGEDLSSFGEAAMKADYLGLTSQTPSTYKTAVRKPWPYTNFGAPQPPLSHTTDTQLAYEHYVFPNGVVLNLKTTHFKNDSVRVAVDFGGGFMAVDPQKKTPFYLLGSQLLSQGGLGRLTASEVGDTLSGHSVTIEARFGSEKTQLVGTTTSSDMAVQMNLLAAYASDAALDPAPFENAKTFIPEQMRTLKASPTGVLGFGLANILLSGDPRFDPNGLNHLDQINYEDVRAYIHGAITDTPITVTIVGDVDPSRAVAEVARTFGAFSARPATRKVFPGADIVKFPPAQKDFTLYHQGRDDQSVSLVLWPTTDYWSKPDDWARIVVLRDLLKSQLFDEVREDQGAAYSPSAVAAADNNFKGYGYIAAVASIKAGGDDRFRASLSHILSGFKSKPVTADALLRVKKPLLDALDTSEKDNDYWLDLLSLIGSDPRQEAVAVNWRSEIQRVTPDDLTRVAKVYMRDAASIHVKVVPEPTAGTSASPQGGQP